MNLQNSEENELRKIYGYPKCSTCKKAQKFMNDNQLGYEIHDITETPPTMIELKLMLKHYSGQMKKLLNTSGQVYREMGLSKKLDTMSQDEVLALLAENGKLVKRPFLIADGQAKCVGFKEDEWKKELL
jgi:Spx/MgsR family transcriptional regulator